MALIHRLLKADPPIIALYNIRCGMSGIVIGVELTGYLKPVEIGVSVAQSQDQRTLAPWSIKL